ncbi:MAG: response regulator, partial [Pseudomonadota bacterium]
LTLPVAEEATAPRLPITLRRVMVVDDQFINRTILERQLVPCGIDVTLCRSGADALATLAAGPGQDLILTDHQMPDMDGLQLTLAVRAAGHGMPIVLLSSNPAEARDSAAMAELAAILQKPILRADLYRKLQALTAPVEEAPPTRATPVETPSRLMRVLAAEDNRTNQLVFQKMVKDLGIELVFANNGREAVELWSTFNPDMIFMDISMPEMDGREAARAIRAAEGGRTHIPIVALTAHAMDGDSEGILAAGIDRYMTKPLRKQAILETLTEFCPAGVHPVQNLREVAA